MGKAPTSKLHSNIFQAGFWYPLSANGLINDAILFQLAMWIINFYMHTVIGACDYNVIS